jgi:hypothetical protein
VWVLGKGEVCEVWGKSMCLRVFGGASGRLLYEIRRVIRGYGHWRFGIPEV